MSLSGVLLSSYMKELLLFKGSSWQVSGLGDDASKAAVVNPERKTGDEEEG